MAFSFPSNPSVNQTYTSGGRTWVWSGSAWQAQGTVVGITGPTGPAGSLFGVLDGGNATSVYGGISALSGGNASGN
jgi:hypothetical protein